jgi:hypothetical protein
MVPGMASESWRVRRRIGSRALAACGLAVTIIATWRPGTFGTAPTRYRLEVQLPTWLLLVLVAAAVLACLAVLSILIAPPRQKDPDDFELEPPPPPRLSPLTLAVVLLAGPAIAFLTIPIVRRMALRSGDAGVGTSWAGLFVPPTPHDAHAPVHVPAFDWSLVTILLLAVLLVTLAALAIIMMNEPWHALSAWLRLRPRRRRTLVRQLAETMNRNISEIEAAADPRQAVIACYRRCERTLASHRRRRYPAETPREYVGEALAMLHLPEGPTAALLEVFERARFSRLPIGEPDRHVALSALAEIRTALEVRVADEPRR